jgi:transcriptional regulator with XRE-family HTH domain
MRAHGPGAERRPQQVSAATEPDWLWVADQAQPLSDVVDVPQVLRAYRTTHGLTQAELAVLLGCDQSYVSRIERARRPVRDVEMLKRIAQRLSIPPRELGLMEAMIDPRRSAGSVGRHSVADDDDGAEGERRVHESQRQWRLVRQSLNRRRSDLTEATAGLYPGAHRVGASRLVTCAAWLPPTPVDLAGVDVRWADVREPFAVTGTEEESAPMRPLTSSGRRYERYSRVIRDIDRPTLFENRIGFRLLDLSWRSAGGEMLFNSTTYFEMVDVCEAVAHELASVCALGTCDEDVFARLPFRQRVGDPFDLWRRPVMPSIDTLTIRRSGGGASFILHYRDPAQVAVAGGMYHVMPAGMFQPATLAPEAQVFDFDLWRNIMREFSEEFLGNAEHDGGCGSPIEYRECEPFRSMNLARDSGRLKVFCLGVGLDPLTLAGEILTVAVIDDDVFDELFGGLVSGNAEGTVVSAGRTRRPAEGIPFTADAVGRLVERKPIAPAAAACLELAWTHRDVLLAV